MIIDESCSDLHSYRIYLFNSQSSSQCFSSPSKPHPWQLLPLNLLLQWNKFAFASWTIVGRYMSSHCVCCYSVM